MKYEDLTGKIIKCAFEVHKILRNGFQEVVYQRALAIEMQVSGLSFEREKEMDIFYKGYKLKMYFFLHLFLQLKQKYYYLSKDLK